jgi:hypothetical protein
VNNAVARVAGLLAAVVLVLGVFVYATFSTDLDLRLEGMDPPAGVREAVEQEKAKLGAAEA